MQMRSRFKFAFNAHLGTELIGLCEKDDLHLGDLAGLMVSSEDGDSILKADLEGDK